MHFQGSHLVTLKKGRGQHSKYLPYVFTEQGVAMLSGVLRSDKATNRRKGYPAKNDRVQEVISKLKITMPWHAFRAAALLTQDP
jgi:hypothetical protein